MVKTAWASASTYRYSDMRGGANGSRIRLEPQRSWKVNNPKELNKVLSVYEDIQKDFKEEVSIADIIVLAGNVGVEKAIKKAGYNVEVPFEKGRGDATQENTDIESFANLDPLADGFRNYINPYTKLSAEELLIDKASLLNLSIPEMTVLIGGLRVLGTNFDNSKFGVFTKKIGTLSNDFFTTILDISSLTWKENNEEETEFVGKDRKTTDIKFYGTRVDLIFGSNTELRAICEVYGSDDGEEHFIKDFVKA